MVDDDVFHATMPFIKIFLSDLLEWETCLREKDLISHLILCLECGFSCRTNLLSYTENVDV